MAGKPLLTVTLAAGSELKFSSFESFTDWHAELMANWKLLTDRGVQFLPAAAEGQEHLRICIRQLTDQIAQHKTTNTVEVCASIENTLRAHFPRGVLFAPDDPVLLGLRRLYPDPQSLALGMGSVVWAEARMNRTQTFNGNAIAHPIAFEAIGFAAALRHMGIRKYGELLEGALTRSRERVEEALGGFRTQSDSTIAKIVVAFDAKTKQVNQEVEALQLQARESIQEIDATHNKYNEVMRFKAPKDYWSTKATEHRGKVDVYRKWLAIVAGITAVVLLGTYGLGYLAMQSFATKHPAQAVAMTIYVAGFVGSITAIGLWFIRIVVRLYMSQHHLATDAEERASFIHTYLALNEGDGVSEGDRTLVLTSIFRPVPDGIIKDDGAPSLSPGSLLASMLDKGK